jgi:predicted NAD-dependent protein-ADP-ribosyltransferase YbiA (DUF1768 family)
MLFHSGAKTEDGRVLSNFYPCEIVYDNLKFKTAEGFFQGLKCLFSDSPRDIFLFQEMEPLEAKRAGRRLKIDIDAWNKHSVESMTFVLKLRYEQDIRFNEVVNKYRSEGLYHFDRAGKKSFWGGEMNMLGKIMMNL